MGPRFIKNRRDLACGTTVLFEDLLKHLDKMNVQYIIIDTHKKNYNNIFHAYFSILYQLLVKQRDCTHISLHSSRDYMFLGIIIILLGKFFNKKTSLRKFAGEAESEYKNAGILKKLYMRTIFTNFDLLFAETKYLVSFFSKMNKNTIWFPNSRNRTLKPNLPRKFRKRFVFISGVIKEKGIEEILKAARELDESYTIEIYGALFNNEYTEEDFENEKVPYKGALQAEEVIPTLNEFDVLLLPSYKEGYPGIILEAYSIGLPVIATNLKGISEIVDEYKTGVLIDPQNVQQLIDAIKYFDNVNYIKMSNNAYKKFDLFRSDNRSQEFIKVLENA